MQGKSMQMVVLIAALTAITVVAVAQQNQANQANQNQSQQPNQTAQPQNQPQQKKSFWQKVRDAKGALQDQNTSQGGSAQQAGQQQGQTTTQQGVPQQAGQQMQQMQNGAQQMQQVQNGAQQMQNGVQQQGAAFAGGGGGAGSCGASCFDAGPFQANVSQMTMSQEGGWHIVRMNIQFHNSTNQPLIIAYHDGSMVMVDNNGNTYVPAGGNPGQLQGMGIDRGNQTDSQFVLAPGQTGNALFSVARGRAANSPIGTGYTYNLTIDELQAQNGALAIPVRTYNLNFPSLVPGSSNANAFATTSPTGGAVAPTGGAMAAQGKGQSVGQRTGVAPQQQRTVNGQVPATPAQGTPASVVNNAAMKTPVPAMKTPVPAPRAPATATRPAPAAKPIPATTAKTNSATTKPAAATTTTTTK